MNCEINNENNKIKVKLKNFIFSIPLHTKIAIIFALISLIVHIATSIFPLFSDFFTRYISSIFRTVIATLTGFFPFSLAETMLFMLPVLLILYFTLSYKHYVKNNNKINSLIYLLVTLLCFMYTLAVFTFLTGYSNSTLDKKLGLKASPITAEELYETSYKVKIELESVLDNITFDDNNASVMPYNITEMSDELLNSYKECSEQYTFLHNINAQIKSVCLSEAMSYTHITGVYTFFTCEANINVVFPDFTIPFTAAHEFAHQRGIARENEANFVAFLICINSNAPYIQYSGYMNMLQYLSNALYSADTELYKQFRSSLNKEILGELNAYSLFFEKYRDSSASKISGAVNDTYLKLQGTEGTKSYGMVVDLAVSYYKNED